MKSDLEPSQIKSVRMRNEYLLVKRVPVEDKSGPGAIIVPASAKKKSLWCEVLSAGPGRPRDDADGHHSKTMDGVKPGSKVLIHEYAGAGEVELADGTVAMLIGIGDVHAVEQP